MAIKRTKPPAPVPTVAVYAANLRRSIMPSVLTAGIISGIFSVIIIDLTGVAAYDLPSTWLIGLTVSILVVVCSLLVLSLVAHPFHTILRAISHVSNEPINGAIPNPNDKNHVKSGLSTAIKTIYSIDSTKANQALEMSASKKSTKYAQLSSSINRMHGAIITLDASGNITYASRSAPTKTVNGALVPQLLFNGSDSLDNWLQDCRETAVRAENIWQRIPDRPSDAEGQRLFDVYASYEKNADHETVLTLIDMTTRYQEDEENLDFIAFAAHELRGPITVIRGYIDVLEQELGGLLSGDQQELFHRLSVSANRLSSYINNILNTSRYDQRHLSVSLSPDTMAGIYSTIQDDMALRASSQNRILSVNIPADLPQIAADRGSLSEVMGNLIDNAIKYSNEGGSIMVSAEQHGDFVELSVTDFGIGMSSSVVKNLFQKFYRSHRSRETVAGSGIGLYISKAIVESHGGTVSVRSTEGKGSTFTFSIPTYASVADKLAANGNNQNLISQGKGWIKNHSMYRG